MCDPRQVVDSVDGVGRLFRSDTKCCTFHPKLPNYLIGSLLSDASPDMQEGQRRVREKIQRRVSVTPEWLRAPPTYTHLYNQARHAFGRSEALRCPYYEKQSGGCTVWRHREAVCSTFFCRYEKGQDGMAMWNQVKRYLALLESHLTRYAIFELMPDYLLEARDDAPTLSAADLDDRVDEKTYAALWGAWAGREEAFYRRCFELVSALNDDAIAALLGQEGKLALAVLEKKHQAATNETLPTTLKWNTNTTVRWSQGGSVSLAAYSELDGVSLDGSAYALLVCFDGTKPVEEVRARLRSEKQADLSEEVLMTLHRHRILI